MKTIELPDLPELSGLKNDELQRVFRLGMAEMAREQAAARPGRAALFVAIEPAFLPALARLAQQHRMTLPDYVAATLRDHCRAWALHLKAAGVEVPGRE